MDPERLGTRLRPSRWVGGEVTLHIDPISLLRPGIIEYEEDRHQLVGPELIVPSVDIEP
jgi:hypothetical protein